jgi:hypothetical protein
VNKPNERRNYALSNPNAQDPRYKGVVKLPRDGLRTVMIRGTGSFVYVEFTATHLPKIELEVL